METEKTAEEISEVIMTENYQNYDRHCITDLGRSDNFKQNNYYTCTHTYAHTHIHTHTHTHTHTPLDYHIRMTEDKKLKTKRKSREKPEKGKKTTFPLQK